MVELQKKPHILVMCVFLLLLGGCATLPDNSNNEITSFLKDTQHTYLGRQFESSQQEGDNLSGFLLLENGLDAFVARVALAQKAERSIDTQYYLLHNDLVGNLFVDQLHKAADRGVRVRLLLDDIDMEGRDFGAAVLDSHPNIAVRIFNPFSRSVGRTRQYIFGFGKKTRRAHNKSFTVDNQATILGGRNIGDEYFDADPDFAFLDGDILATGPVVEQVSYSFDKYWNSDLSYPISILLKKEPSSDEISAKKRLFDAFIAEQWNSPYHSHLLESNLAKKIHNDELELSWAEGFVVDDDPEKIITSTKEKQYWLSEKLAPHITGIKSELIVYSPYFVPGKAGIVFFQNLRDKGVDVKILTNSLSSTDVSIVHAGYANYRKELLKMGVKLFELNVKPSLNEQPAKESNQTDTNLSLHTKCFIMDRNKTFIGSLNLDARSIVQNTEIGLIVDSQSIATFLAEDFDEHIDEYAFRLSLISAPNGTKAIRWHGLESGEKRIFDHDPYTGFWQRVGVHLMGLLPIESQI